MASEFKHLEYLPLDEDNLVVNDDPESNLRSKSCINLGFIGLNTITRFKKIGAINAQYIQGIDFLDVSYALESALMTLLTLDTISNPQHTEVTEHYSKRNVSISANKILPSFGYCQNLTFTGFKPWGGLYGTVAYYINLLEDYEEYYTPSEIAYFSINSLIDYSRSVSYNAYINNANTDYLLMSEFYERAKTIIDDESLEADKKIYDLSKNIILTSPLIQESYAELRFLIEWIPKVFDWYLANLSKYNLQVKEAPTTNEQRAINTLFKVIIATYENGFSKQFSSNMPAKFIKQSLPSNTYNLLEAVGNIRSTITYVIENESIKSEAELLTIELMENLSKFRQPSDYFKASNTILETFAPPGGYDLFLVALATQLVNRAYILSYKNINSAENIFLSDVYKRVNKLIGYAGILLIKTSLPHAQTFGINLLKTFKIFLTDIDPNNLLDL